jgi:hypothetical protein
MNAEMRIFDFLDYQLTRFPILDMLASKENGAWVTLSNTEVKKQLTYSARVSFN